MIGSRTVPGEDRAWRLGAYALAALVHVPLIMAVQQFGSAIAAARPTESVITLLDMPETRRMSALEASDGRLDAVTQGAAVRTASPNSATRLQTPATATAIAPTPMSSPAAVPLDAPTDIASIIASETLAPTSEVQSALSPQNAAVATTAVQTPAPVPDVAGATDVVAPVAEASPTTPIRSFSSIAPIRTALPAPAQTTRTAALPTVASTTTDAVTEAIMTAAAASVADTTSPTTPVAAPTLPRIAIVATTSMPAPIGSSRVVAVSGPVAPPATGQAMPAPMISAPSARVVSSVLPAVRVAGRAPTVAGPVVDPSPRRLEDAVPARAVAAPEPAARIAAVPPDAAGAGADRESLNAFVRAYEGGGCFAALTVASAGDDAAVSGFSRDESALAGFQDALGRRSGSHPSTAGRRVSEAQCSVLAFAKAQAAYPDFPVRLMLDPDRIRSGGTIGGTIAGGGDRPVTMLILDDEGRIQDASFLLSRRENGDWSFRTPLSLTGSPVPTVQLFVALAGDGPLAAMRPPVPVEARRYFAEIDRLLKARKQALDVALAAFTVDETAAATAP